MMNSDGEAIYGVLSAFACDKNLRAARANRIFRADDTVIGKSNDGLGLLLSKIADCAWMRFSSAHNRRSARTGRRPRKLWHRCLTDPAASADDAGPPLRAPRANPVFGTDEKRIRTKNTVLGKSNDGLGLLLYNIATLQQRGARSRPPRIAS
jgi:hypothetical protein